MDTCSVHGGVPKLALSDEMSDSKLSPQKLRDTVQQQLFSDKQFISLQNLFICKQVSAKVSVTEQNLRAHWRVQSTARETLSRQIN